METFKESILENYGFKAVAFEAMAGYGSINYKISTDTDEVYVLKVYENEDDAMAAFAESEILLKTDCEELETPRPIFNKLDKHLTKDSKLGYYRILSFLKGSFWGDQKINDNLLSSLGSCVAHLQLAMSGIKETAIKSRVDTWDLKYCLQNQKLLEYIPASSRSLVHYFFDQFECKVLVQMGELEQGYIQGDFNEWNILTNGQAVTGVIDFGDMCYSPLIFDLAIALSYACVGFDDPLAAAVKVIKSYHAVKPLTQKEISVLYYCVPARLCTSLVNSAYKKTLHPDNPYFTISEKGLWKLLHQWIEISPIKFEHTVSKAVGIDEVDWL